MLSPFNRGGGSDGEYSSTQVKGALVFAGILAAALWAITIPLLLQENPNWFVCGTAFIATVAFVGGFFQLRRVKASEAARGSSSKQDPEAPK